jgi:hypothetical protein
VSLATSRKVNDKHACKLPSKTVALEVVQNYKRKRKGQLGPPAACKWVHITPAASLAQHFPMVRPHSPHADSCSYVTAKVVHPPAEQARVQRCSSAL